MTKIMQIIFAIGVILLLVNLINEARKDHRDSSSRGWEYVPTLGKCAFLVLIGDGALFLLTKAIFLIGP